MSNGITEDMKKFTSMMSWRAPKERPKRERDRTLAGKARIEARRNK